MTVINIQKTSGIPETLVPWKSRRRNDVACFPRPEPETAISGVERQLGTTLSGGESRMKQAAGWLQRAQNLCTSSLRLDPCRVHQRADA